MITICTMGLVFVAYWTFLYNSNPVKMSLCIAIVGALASLIMASTGLLLVPLVFYLLFMGGLLVLFMVISAVIPNEASMGIKMYFVMILLFIFLAVLMQMSNIVTSFSESTQVKTFLMTNSFLIMIISLITLYFLVFITMLSMNATSLRSEAC